MNIQKIVLSGLCTGILLSGCNHKAAAETVRPAKAKTAVESRNPEIIKLQKVLSSMSQRAKDSIPNGNPEEFLADLHAVIDDDPDGLLILCDKTHPVGKNYAPADILPLVKNPYYSISRNTLSLRKPAVNGLLPMAQAAKAEGITLLVSSTYRTYEYQVTVYNRLVAQDGQEAADRESARPGTSQHQLGTVIDFGSISDEYAQTKAGRWLTANAARYGWSLSFPQGYEGDTGYRWECWHYRYIGVKACRFQKKWFSDIQQYMLEFINNWKNS